MSKSTANFKLSKSVKRMLTLFRFGNSDNRAQFKSLMIAAEMEASRKTSPVRDKEANQ